ncbi:energy transducer TonB [Collimonas pratensis]|uniref:energy transducer TonB n=1 Tax=Collimonas pratensis TaxID=279113 RepID=UPI003C7265A2
MHVSPEGRVLETRVESSSGHPLLDSSAASGLSQCEFEPAKANNVTIDSWIKMQYSWRIE